MKTISAHLFLGLLVWASIAPATADPLPAHNGALSGALIQSAVGSSKNVAFSVPSIVPEPRSIILLGTTLVIVCGVFRRKFRRAVAEVR
jgi:hypothetical protein